MAESVSVSVSVDRPLGGAHVLRAPSASYGRTLRGGSFKHG